jgi:hypothetical protein
MSGSILSFSEDITNATPPAPLPPGPYPAEIIGAQKRTSATTGKEYAQIMFRINAESYPADYTEGDPDGTTLSYNRLQVDDSGSKPSSLACVLGEVWWSYGALRGPQLSDRSHCHHRGWASRV